MPGRVEDPDWDDVRGVLAGDPGRFEGIVRRWQSRLINLAWRFCHDRVLAEDMAQEAFVAIYQALKTFRGESAFSTWLTTVALNCYRSRLRKRVPVFVSLDAAPMAGVEPSALRVLQDRERDVMLRELVLTLPPRYRDPIVMYYFHDMNLNETARTLGVPDGTVKARLSRGRALLERRYTARVGATMPTKTVVREGDA